MRRSLISIQELPVVEPSWGADLSAAALLQDAKEMPRRKVAVVLSGALRAKMTGRHAKLLVAS
jgi:hypothetical protein